MNFFNLFLGIAFIVMALYYITWAVEDSCNDEKVQMWIVWIDISVVIVSFIAGILNMVTAIASILQG